MALNPLGKGSSEDAAVEKMKQMGGAEAFIHREPNPEAESAPPEANPEGKARDNQGRFTKEPAEEQEVSQEDLSSEDQEEPVEAQPDEDVVELADTLEGLAEQLDIEPDVLKTLKVKVKEHGEETQVTLQDALNGHLAEREFQRKSADIAEKNREIESIQASVSAERQHYADQLTPFIQQLSQVVQTGEQGLMDMLNQDSPNYDPEGYMREKIRHDALKQAEDAARQEQQRIINLQAQEHARFVERDMDENEQKLIAAIPAWKDRDVGRKELDNLRRYAVEHGIPKQLVEKEYRAPFLLTLRKAKMYDDLQASQPQKKVKGLSKVLKPGVSKGVEDPAKQRHLVNLKRFRKDKSVESAAALFKSGGFVR